MINNLSDKVYSVDSLVGINFSLLIRVVFYRLQYLGDRNSRILMLFAPSQLSQLVLSFGKLCLFILLLV